MEEKQLSWTWGKWERESVGKILLTQVRDQVSEWEINKEWDREYRVKIRDRNIMLPT